jgi:hypothetical protein
VEIGRIRTGLGVTGAAALAALLCGCAGSATDTMGSLIVAPGKYDFYSCEQLGNHLKAAIVREQELKGLIDKAERDTSGAVVSAFAYRTDYATARGNVLLIKETAEKKSCPPQP